MQDPNITEIWMSLSVERWFASHSLFGDFTIYFLVCLKAQACDDKCLIIPLNKMEKCLISSNLFLNNKIFAPRKCGSIIVYDMMRGFLNLQCKKPHIISVSLIFCHSYEQPLVSIFPFSKINTFFDQKPNFMKWTAKWRRQNDIYISIVYMMGMMEYKWPHFFCYVLWSLRYRENGI